MSIFNKLSSLLMCLIILQVTIINIGNPITIGNYNCHTWAFPPITCCDGLELTYCGKPSENLFSISYNDTKHNLYYPINIGQFEHNNITFKVLEVTPKFLKIKEDK